LSPGVPYEENKNEPLEMTNIACVDDQGGGGIEHVAHGTGSGKERRCAKSSGQRRVGDERKRKRTAIAEPRHRRRKLRARVWTQESWGEWMLNTVAKKKKKKCGRSRSDLRNVCEKMKERW